MSDQATLGNVQHKCVSTYRLLRRSFNRKVGRRTVSRRRRAGQWLLEGLETRTLMSGITLGATPILVDQDLGSPSQHGSVLVDGTTYTLTGGGLGIGGTSDQFNFASIAATGDKTLITEITNFSSSTALSEGGIMFRASNAANSAFVDIMATPGQGILFQARSSAGGTIGQIQKTNVAEPTANAPVYFKLAKFGTTVLGSYSTDGSTWTVVGSAQLTGTTYNAGLAVSAHSSNNTNTVRFVNTDLGNTALNASSDLVATAKTPTQIQLAWVDHDTTAAVGYNVLRSTDGIHFTKLAVLSSPGAVGYTDNTAASYVTYYYEIQAFNGSVVSGASSMASARTAIAAPSGFVATVKTPTSVQLTWTNNAGAETLGYYILRATDGLNFTKIGTVNSGTTTTYTDSTASSCTSYQYEVQAFNGSATSAMSLIAGATTTVSAPSGVTATVNNSNSITLNWMNNDAKAQGYIILRTLAGGTFTQVAKLTGNGIHTWTDGSVASGATYNYRVEAYYSSSVSAVSNTAVAISPVGAPSDVHVSVLAPTTVQLSWTSHDSTATGYYILRATDSVHFTAIAQITSATITTYQDKTVSSGHSYQYEIQAYKGSVVSAVSSMATTTTSLAAPTGFSASAASSTQINLTWTDKDASATGYFILRSTDNSTFTQIATVSGVSAHTYADNTVSGGQTYYYKVEAANSVATSAASNVGSTLTPGGGGGGGGSNGVAITTRYGDELVINATGSDDSVTVLENGLTLTITADGQTYNDAAPTAGLFIYTRGGNDAINIGSTVTDRTTIESIDGAMTTINTAGTNVSVWADSTDSIVGAAAIHRVANFAGGVSKAFDAALADPSDAGATTATNASLWGTGPVAGDVNQGEVGDCYFLSSLAAFAGENPTMLRESAVDMGDGTSVVQFFRNGTATFIRIADDFTSGPFNGFMYANPGANGTIWAMVMEKAFCYFRTGANTYNSINSGWMSEVYSDLGVSSTNFVPTNYSESAFYNMLEAELAAGKAVTLGTQNAPNLVSGHAYTLVSVSIDGNGVTHYTVRNPWGVSGDSMENAQGYATLTFAQMKSNFVMGCAAV